MKPYARDDHFLRRALLQARGAAGGTWPNPTVGAVLVDSAGRLLGEGHHVAPGRAHAEVEALHAARAAGHDPRGATLYVTLEPCNHHGRTPPCTDAIRAAGIARVVVACADDNPRVTGGGNQALRAHGIAVELASARWQDLARELNHPFFETEGGARPHVTLKLAVSADGKLARRFGRVDDASERAISGVLAQRRAHRLRAGASCIVVGRGTIEADGPRLDVRHVPSTRRPRPIVLDGELRCDPARLPTDALIFHAAGHSGRQRAAQERVAVPRGPIGLDWDAILEELAARRLGIVLVEGGAAVAASLLAAGRADRVHLFRAPLRVAAPAPEAPPIGPEFALLRERRIGPDRELVYRRVAPKPVPSEL